MNEQIIFTIVDSIPFKEGTAAGEKNLLTNTIEKITNPYPKGSSEWTDWVCGYNQVALSL